MTPEEVVGIAMLLKVELTLVEKDKKVLRDGDEIILDIFNQVEKMNRARRRKLMLLLRKSVKGMDVSNDIEGSNSISSPIRAENVNEDTNNGTNTEN